VIPAFPRRAGPVLAALIAIAACSLEKPDPASQAAAILSKRPSTFRDRLVALDDLASRELGIAGRTTLAESLYHYSARLRPRLAAAASDSSRVEILNAFFFDSLRIEPQLEDSTLAGSLPSRVLAERRGACVGLVLLYLALGDILELPLAPVFLPGHVMVRWRGGGQVRNIEILRRGIARSDSFYRETFALDRRPWYALSDARPDQALAALVFNLANHHRSRGFLDAALEEYRLVEERLPGFPEALGNQGAAYLLAGDRPRAREKLNAALAGDSLAEPARRNLEAHFDAD
jgi:regulator of sirC expression with transglutaminase-like and TPR domain